MVIKLKKGLNIPIAGSPQQRIHDSPAIGSVAVLGTDFVDLKPRLHVQEGDGVVLGQPLFSDKSNPGVSFTSPGCGTVTSINRGARRALLSVVIRLDGDEEERFDAFRPDQLAGLGEEEIKSNLLASGLWTALRTRPYSKVPAPDSRPGSLFVNAMDSNPLAADPAVIIAEARDDFASGLQVLSSFTGEEIFLCTAAGAEVPGGDLPGIRKVEFSGPHPAGLVGTHIHYLAPVHAERTAWHLNYQDVIAIGRLFTTGRIPVERVVALAGPAVKQPRLVRTRLGADLRELVSGELEDLECRVLSGSILSGRRAAGPLAYLGRYDLQVSVLAEGRERQFLGWLAPGARKFSASRAFLSSLLPRRRLPLTTSQNGSPRAMIPVGAYQNVMPLNMLPTQLLRALVVGDTDMAQALGCLELDEEDLALCSFVCPSKYDYGPVLRETLSRIEREG